MDFNKIVTKIIARMIFQNFKHQFNGKIYVIKWITSFKHT
jgi:hypothetical protein